MEQQSTPLEFRREERSNGAAHRLQVLEGKHFEYQEARAENYLMLTAGTVSRFDAGPTGPSRRRDDIK